MSLLFLFFMGLSVLCFALMATYMEAGSMMMPEIGKEMTKLIFTRAAAVLLIFGVLAAGFGLMSNKAKP